MPETVKINFAHELRDKTTYCKVLLLLLSVSPEKIMMPKIVYILVMAVGKKYKEYKLRLSNFVNIRLKFVHV